VIDLDPKEAPFSDVVRTAQVLHTLWSRLPAELREDHGKTGLHILLPLAASARTPNPAPGRAARARRAA